MTGVMGCQLHPANLVLLFPPFEYALYGQILLTLKQDV